MTIFDENHCALLIVDIQEKLLNAVFNKELLIKNAEILAKAAEMLNIPVFITEQYPKGLGSTVSAITNVLNAPNVFEKVSFNAFEDEKIYDSFKKINKKQVIVCGIETHICVYQTANHLLNNGYDVALIKNCCGSRLEYEHNSALLSLNKFNNCDIKTTEMILFELLKSAKHPNFKEIQSLIK